MTAIDVLWTLGLLCLVGALLYIVWKR